MTWKTPFDIETTGNVNATGSINANSFTDTEDLLSEAVLWLDADYSGGGQTIKNLGRGGRQLDAQNGSTSGEDSNDAKFLNWPGDNAGNYVYLPGANGNYLSVPDEAALDITGDIDLRVRVALDDWSSSSNYNFVSKFEDAGDQRGFMFRYFGTAGTGILRFDWSTGGIGATYKAANSTTDINLADGEVSWVRVTVDVDNGASGHDIKFYKSADGSSWTQIGTTVTTAGTTSIFATTTPVRIGASQGGGADPLAGKVYRAQILDGIDGTTVLDVDTSLVASGSDTSFTALTGQTVTINRSTSGRKSVAVVSPVWLFGTDDVMRVPVNPLLAFDSATSFSVVIFVRKFGRTSATTATYIGTSNAGNGFEGFLFRENGSNDDTAFVLDGGGTNSANASVPAVGGTLAAMSFVIDRNADTLVVQSNASTSNAASIASVTDIPMTSALTIGGESGAASNDMEFVAAAVFRRALSASEIASISSYYQNRLS